MPPLRRELAGCRSDPNTHDAARFAYRRKHPGECSVFRVLRARTRPRRCASNRGFELAVCLAGLLSGTPNAHDPLRRMRPTRTKPKRTPKPEAWLRIPFAFSPAIFCHNAGIVKTGVERIGLAHAFSRSRWIEEELC